MIIYSELWGANSKAAQQMWTETTLSPTKFGRSFRWVETYAGHTGEAAILEQLYYQGVTQGEHIGAELGFPDLNVYRNRTARLFCLWNDRPRLPWQIPEYYAQEASILTPNEFLRVHRNQWVTSEDVFVPAEWWDACKGTLSTLATVDPVVIAADAAVSGDCFGVVAVSRGDAGVEVRSARKWTPPPNGKIIFSNPDDPDDPHTPEGIIRRLCDDFNVIEIAYDPYQLHDFATRLKQQGYPCREFPQGQDRLIADKQLYDIIREKRITHDGAPDLSEHVKNANSKADGDKLRIVKRSDAMKIDLAVALSMATARIMKLMI